MARLALLAVVLAGCDTIASGDVFEAKIEEQLTARGVATEVTCPDRIPLGMVEDNHFDCTVREDNGTTTEVVITLDEHGAWRLAVKPP